MEIDHGLFGKESSITPSPNEEEIIYTSQNVKMDYLTLKGIETRTGVEKDSLPGFVLKEKLDNAADYMESEHTIKPQIEVNISKTESFLQIKVSNTNNGKQIFSKDRLQSIFDSDKAYSSKRNIYKITRGALGDAFKEIICAPYALARDNKSAKWNEPLIIRNNKTFKVHLVIDRAHQTFLPEISELEMEFDVKHKPNNTNSIEVETHLPLTASPNDTINLLGDFVINYAVLNPHIGFSISLPNRVINLPQTQPMLAKWSNQTSIYYYSLQEFEDFISGLENSELQIYKVLYNATFREVSNISKSEFPQMTVGQLKQSPGYGENIYELLHDCEKTKMGPPTELSLPFSTKQGARKKAIEDRLKQAGIPCKLVKYKQKSGYYLTDGNGIQVPFFFEVTVVHSDSPPVNVNLDLIESLNSSTMPNNYHVFHGSHENTFEWWSSKGDTVQNGKSIMDIFRKYGYSHNEKDCKKKHSIIIVNLISPKIDFRSYGKSIIDVTPFADVIAETTAKACKGGGGNSGGNEDKKKATEIFQKFLGERLREVQNNPRLKLTDPWNTSTPVYRIRPVLEKAGLGHLTRKYLQGLVRKICVEKLGRNREDFGIYEKAHAQLYFKGKIYDVTYDKLEEIKKKGFAVLVIEKSGIVKLQASFADDYGFALCETTGFLSDNARKLCELSSQAGGNIAILTDDDMSGHLIASKVPKIPRIGITLHTLKALGIPLEEVAENLSKKSTHANKVEDTYRKGEITITKDDWIFLNRGNHGSRIEIDNVIGYVGAKIFWEDFVVKEFKKLFPSHDYTRSVDVPEYVVPETLQKFNDMMEERGKLILNNRRTQLQNRLSNFKGGFLFDRTNRVLPNYNIRSYEESIAYQSKKIIESDRNTKPVLEELENLMDRMWRAEKIGKERLREKGWKRRGA